MAKRTPKQPLPPKAPLGPPPPLPSEQKTEATGTGEAEASPKAETQLEKLLKGRNPAYPFIPPHRLGEAHIQNDLEGANRIYKIMMFYEEFCAYQMLVKHFGQEHKFYKDKLDYGNQEENQSQQRGRPSAGDKRHRGGSFHNS